MILISISNTKAAISIYTSLHVNSAFVLEHPFTHHWLIQVGPEWTMYLLSLTKNCTEPIILCEGPKELSYVDPRSPLVRFTAKYQDISMIFKLSIPAPLSDSNHSVYQDKDAHRQNLLLAMRIIGHR
jgi:hypothetical protein